MTSVTDALQAFLDRLARHSVLGADECQAILSLPGTIQTVGYHRYLVRNGGASDDACLVMDGVVARVRQHPGGARQISALHIAGDMPDLHAIVWPKNTAALQALTPATIARVPYPALRLLAARYPAIAEAFWRDCLIDGAIMSDWVFNIGRRDARTRLAHLFCEMAVRSERVGVQKLRSFAFPITQSDLGDALSLTAIHVNRMLKSLRAEGLISAKERERRILDWPGLVRAGDFDPDYLDLAPDSRSWPTPSRIVSQFSGARAAPERRRTDGVSSEPPRIAR